MNKINISKTFLIAYTSRCKYEAYLRYVEKRYTEPSLAMIKGNLFEYLLIGSTVTGQVPEMPKLVKGGMSADEIAVRELVVWAKPVLEKMNFIKETVQETEIFEDCKMVKDVQGSILDTEAIIDIKYTDTKEDDRWQGWGGDMKDMEYWDFTEPIHSIYIHLMNTGELLPFIWLVFGKGKWIKPFKIEVSRETCELHGERIAKVRKQIENNEFEPCNNFSTCNKCDYNPQVDKSGAVIFQCPKAKTYPDFIEKFIG